MLRGCFKNNENSKGEKLSNMKSELKSINMISYERKNTYRDMITRQFLALFSLMAKRLRDGEDDDDDDDDDDDNDVDNDDDDDDDKDDDDDDDDDDVRKAS